MQGGQHAVVEEEPVLQRVYVVYHQSGGHACITYTLTTCIQGDLDRNRTAGGQRAEEHSVRVSSGHHSLRLHTLHSTYDQLNTSYFPLQ